MLTPLDIQFILQNDGADVTRLLLGKAPAGVNLPLCAKCIQAREKMKVKAPLWYAHSSLAYPFGVSVEQGSSQATALFKQNLIKELSGSGIITADLTGGMGIDSYFISRIASTHYYFERNIELCEATAYNFRQLGAENIVVAGKDITADNCSALSELEGKGISLLYIDPARRTQSGGKAILLQDYEPNIIELTEKMFTVSRYILAKVSPMADIKLNLKHLPKAAAIYIVAVGNECKELLFLLDREHDGSEPPIHCYNIALTSNHPDDTPGNLHIIQKNTIKISEEDKAVATYATSLGKYLYEPDKAILKSGAYKLISQMHNCHKLAVSTHLYTSNDEILQFPGKRFVVEEVVEFNKRALKEIAGRYPKADITARNFSMDTNALKKLSGIKDGGTRHIFAVTLSNGKKVLAITSPDTYIS